MAIRKWLEPPKAAMGHPIREAKLLLAASRAVAWLVPGNSSAGQLSAQSCSGGNTICNQCEITFIEDHVVDSSSCPTLLKGIISRLPVIMNNIQK